MSSKSNEKENPQNAKVLKLGFNISVSGDPGSDFEIVLDDKGKTELQSPLYDEEELKSSEALEAGNSNTNMLKYEFEKGHTQEAQSTGAIPKYKNSRENSNSLELQKSSKSEIEENSVSKDASIISKIKSTMEQFEKFSDHIKEIPRLRNCPIATSTPFSDKYNSKSESSLVCSEYKPKKHSHFYDYYSRKEYFKSYGKPSPPDLFLKPLPSEGYYNRGLYTRYIDVEPYRHYASDITLNKESEYKTACVKSTYDFDKYEDSYVTSEPLSGILKKSDSESRDKQSTSSADSIKDIKIYQSGGILIMQNFKDNMDAMEKKEISEFSAKLIENCNKLKMEVSGFQEDKPLIENSSEENKNCGKMVQFDLSSIEGQKSKSGDSSSIALKDESSGKMESSESTSDCMKNKDASPPGTSQSQDFPSLSTQENDSVLSNQPGMSPTCTSSKKLEWDSGADIGYLNLDLTKENLSAIEKIVLKGLSSDGLSKKSVVYEKTPEQNHNNRSKFILERKASDLALEENMNRKTTKSKDVDALDRETNQEENEKGDCETRKPVNAGGIFKGENRIKLEETNSTRSKNLSKEVSSANRREILPAEKLETSEKSVNVNTLFESARQQTIPKEIIKASEPQIKPKQKKVPKVNSTKSKKPPSHRLRTPKKSVSVTSANLLNEPPSTFEMGVPKKVYKKVEANPTINDIELSREVNEIIIDQRFKIKTGKESETSDKDQIDNTKEVKSKSRPISASSSSNNTVLPKSDNKENVEEKEQRFTDQRVQTSDYDCHSVGVQAFASQVSSDCDLKSFRKTEIAKLINTESVNTCSKNIQAFGLNLSLPKQLEHPKETEIFDRQNTKSTQFFGGPINSLPNYHSNLVTKPGESCGRAPSILKTKKSAETEIIRLREENDKNILANDASILAEPKRDSKKHDNENKENIISQKSTNSKRSQSKASRKDLEKKDPKKADKNPPSVEGSDCLHTSDEVSSMVLTSEVLREHGDSIDRNIIQEKYFQSQLVELEKRKMISRSTSMEIQLQLESAENAKEYMTTGCQYSPQSRGTTSGGHYQEPDDGSYKDDPSRRSQCETLKDTNREPNSRAGDSLPSSTQTAHSWIPGMQNIRENTTGVGRARSFEYLPGHIYESSGNLREELPSETEQNLITSYSDSETAKGSASEGGDKNSEGRNTLILENSTDNSHDSDRLKILNESLAELNFAVMKLREKDAQVQNVTKSLLANLWKKMGSGDSLPLGEGHTSKTNLRSNKNSPENEKEANNTLSEISTQELKKDTKEFSIACQTELKSQSSDSEKFSDKRKILEKRISEEKKSQIKWIENEIHHLNILKELLEQRNTSARKKKKHSFLTMSSNDKSEENLTKNAPDEICPRTVTPVYGCTISISDTTNNPSEESNPPAKEPESQTQYGMTLSFCDNSKNWKRLVTIPVDLQLSLKDINIIKNNTNEEEKNTQSCSYRKSRLKFDEPTKSRDRQHRSNVCTQHPSPRRILTKLPASSQTEFSSGRRICCCNQDICVCLNLSGNSSISVSGPHSSRSHSVGERNLSKLPYQSEESDPEKRSKLQSVLNPLILDNQDFPAFDSGNKSRRKSSEKRSNSPNYHKCKSAPSSNCKCQSPTSQQIRKFSSESTDNETKHITIQSTSSKFQNCSNQLPFTVNKSPATSRDVNQPNSLSENTNDYRCSKIHLQKSSNCGCHVIKIHGPTCCSSEKSSCSCRGRKSLRITENRFTQSDCKFDIQSEEIKLSKRDCGTSTSEKLTGKMSTDMMDDKEELDPKSGPNCSCRKKIDEHPRHYFLKIEEKEVDDLSKPMEQKKSLEVITVTIPVKKAGKGKIYENDFRQSRHQFNQSLKYPSKECNCGGKCGNSYQAPSRDYEQDFNPCYSRIRAEKPESPKRSTGILKPHENHSYEDFYSKEEPRKYSFSPKYNQESDEFEDGITKPDSNSNFKCCGGCNCINKRENQKEYDSHKRRKCNVEKYDKENRFSEGAREERKMSQKCERQYEVEPDWDLESRQFRGQQFNREVDKRNPEYYNYNKREFMTKSEIRKEEEEKRKTHQPSLQEYLCSNRPDFYNSAERRREIISERSKDRLKRKNSRMECLLKMLSQCNEKDRWSKGEPKRIFTGAQMREQTLKRYKKLPEVTEKIADQKKKEEYRTNRLVADIFAKKLQIEALKGMSSACGFENT